ncbi:glutamate 5-kinase [Anaeromyxobacter diazotrophicus]|uniref:Glutamate 5-kinase n=1 Tax=Anaeromyxobacter diazotrophicus TaxID=2590199 RepID=A0A7I9VTB8_9BACT|nr:glutamate 5-kinase [Anaeromyxobacter diazotrophicus]GEJ59478.1 glutamate 5-kinase [Anaeromyxobacter diazotrophicus]
MPRNHLAHTKTLVVKVGTGTLTDASGRVDPQNCARLAAELAKVGRGRRLVLVSSGAIAFGAERLGLVRSRAKPWDIATKQAAAAVGQPDLFRAWGEAFAPHGVKVAQVLLTAEDLANRKRFLNARRTFARLLELGVLPIVNENDTVAVAEIKVGDNDSLAALVAGCVEAELVVMLTDVDGLYDRDPRQAGARLFELVPRVTAEVERIAGGAGSERSVGGMATKVRAARRLSAQGTATALLSGRRPRALLDLLAGVKVGTLFPPEPERLNGRKGWLAAAARGKGTILVDAGAARALKERGKSLLPSGVRSVDGQFGVGDPVDIAVDRRRPFARGLAGYGADEVRRIAGLKTSEIERALGYKDLDEVVHRNDMVLLDAGPE